jgi:hypothetical protein
MIFQGWVDNAARRRMANEGHAKMLDVARKARVRVISGQRDQMVTWCWAMKHARLYRLASEGHGDTT